MRCPRCGAQNRAGAAVCAKCDEILDPSQFDESDDGDSEALDEDRTDVGPAPTAVQAAQAARARATAASQAKRPANAPAAKQGPLPSAGRAIPAPEVRRPYLADAPDELPPDPLQEAQRSAGELRDLFLSLTISDRAAAGASMVLFFLLIFAWRNTRADDEIIGFVAAFPAAILSVGITALVYFRARRANAVLAQNLQLAQAGCALLLAGFCAWFLRSSTEGHTLHITGHAITTMISEPGMAAYLGTACALIALFASAATALGNRRQ